MENVQKLIRIDNSMLESPALRSEKAKGVTDWQSMTPHAMGDTRMKLRINDYNIPYDRVRSGTHDQYRHNMGRMNESDDQFEERLRKLDD